MNTRKFKEIFLEYAKTGVRPDQYKSAVSRFIREYHHLSKEKFLEYREEFAAECESDTTINHCHCYLPANFENDFLNLCYYIQQAIAEVKFENMIVEGLFILDKFIDDYAEMLFDVKKTVASINQWQIDRDRAAVCHAAQRYIDFNKSVYENFYFIKSKCLKPNHDDYLKAIIKDMFLCKKLNKITDSEKNDLFEKGVTESMAMYKQDLIFGNSN